MAPHIVKIIVFARSMKLLTLRYRAPCGVRLWCKYQRRQGMSGFSPALVRQQLQSAVMLRNASRTMPLRDWKGALNRFTIRFEERMLPD
jgi:hypothetical protein